MSIPELQDVMLYLDSSGGTSWAEDEVDLALSAELAAQQTVVRSEYFIEDTEDEDYREYGADLAEALKRRVARNLAMRALPLSVTQGDVETSPAYLPRYDPEIRRLEAPYRRLVVG